LGHSPSMTSPAQRTPTTIPIRSSPITPGPPDQHTLRGSTQRAGSSTTHPAQQDGSLTVPSGRPSEVISVSDDEETITPIAQTRHHHLPVTSQPDRIHSEQDDPPPRYEQYYRSPDVALFNLYPAVSEYLAELGFGVREFALVYQALNYEQESWLELFREAGMTSHQAQQLEGLVVSVLPAERSSILQVSDTLDDSDDGDSEFT